jgi:serine/threonine-protein kinase
VAGCTLDSVLGRGGMGAVYRARSAGDGAPVAVKVLDPRRGAAEDDVKKFVRGAVAAAQIQHPNVVAIHKVGRDEPTGLHYMVMELLEGRSLGDILTERGTLPPEEAVSIVLQAADALGAAHARRIIHRDVKPDNLMVLPGNRVKITDIGLARVVQGAMKTTKVMGTPHYMPPEQFEGKGMDGRTDVYALGVTLYHALSGAFPYEGASSMQVVFAILSRPPRPLTDANPKAPPALWPVIARMIARRPEDRYPDMAAVRAALAAAMPGVS